jgi:hypothetical protein
MAGAFEGGERNQPVAIAWNGCEQRNKYLVADMIPINLIMPEEARPLRPEGSLHSLQAADIACNMQDTDNRSRICDITEKVTSEVLAVESWL